MEDSYLNVCRLNDYRSILRYEFSIRKERNPSYSLRAFARDLRISASMLSDVLTGKHGLSVRSARKVALAMGLRSREVEYFGDLVESEEGWNSPKYLDKIYRAIE